MEEAIAWILVVIAVAVALPFVIRYILIGVYWFFTVLSTQVFGGLDQIFGAPSLPHAPWAMWLLWVAVIGAALAFWMHAPIYGLRKYRAWIAAAPFILMVVLGLIRMAIPS
jgi:hypothetical protein